MRGRDRASDHSVRKGQAQEGGGAERTLPGAGGSWGKFASLYIFILFVHLPRQEVDIRLCYKTQDGDLQMTKMHCCIYKDGEEDEISSVFTLHTQANADEGKEHAESRFCAGSAHGLGGHEDMPDSPLLMTFFSTHHSPSTVKRKARVFTMGTVKLSSARYQCWPHPIGSTPELTSLADEKEEPHATRQVDKQRGRVAWVPEQVHDAEEGAVEL
jgi:hypothetical protein